MNYRRNPPSSSDMEYSPSSRSTILGVAGRGGDASASVSNRSFVITGEGPLAAVVAAALRQCGCQVRVVKAAKSSVSKINDLGSLGSGQRRYAKFPVPEINDLGSRRPGQEVAVEVQESCTSLAAPVGPAIEMLTVAVADSNAPLCHVAANDDGVCRSFTDARMHTPVALPLTAFRRAASLAEPTASSCGPATPIPHKTFMTIAARQIAHNILRAGPARSPAGTVTFLDRRTLRTSMHNVTVHPYDVPAQRRTPDERREPRNGTPPFRQVLCRQVLAQRWQRLSDQRFGAFAELDDTEFRQLPLKVTLARMSDPCQLLPAPPAVVGVGIDQESARERAIFQALAAYGSIVIDPRLLLGENEDYLGPRDGDPRQLLRSLRDGSVDAFVRATDLTDGRERLVPAQQAFPVLRTPTLAAAMPCGTSAALTWRQALTHGLLQHCVRLTVSGSPFQARRPSALAAGDFDQDPGVRFLAAMVKAAGVGFTLHDITGPAGVPVVACRSASGETVYGGGAQLADAVREALIAILFRYQLRCDPVLSAAMSTAASAVWTNPADLASLNPDELVQALMRLGCTPSVFALDHDRVVHETFPHVLRVIA